MTSPKNVCEEATFLPACSNVLPACKTLVHCIVVPLQLPLGKHRLTAGPRIVYPGWQRNLMYSPAQWFLLIITEFFGLPGLPQLGRTKKWRQSGYAVIVTRLYSEFDYRKLIRVACIRQSLVPAVTGMCYQSIFAAYLRAAPIFNPESAKRTGRE